MDPKLSRRERQIMDILHRRGRASIAEVLSDLPDPPTDSAIRAALRLLERKGKVHHTLEGTHNVYAPTEPADAARRSALQHLIETFFRGSRRRAVAAMLDLDDLDVTEDELDRIAGAVRERASQRRESGESKATEPSGQARSEARRRVKRKDA